MSYNFLVVDDTNFMRKMAADCLKQYGHVVVGEATNGREAIKKYEELRPDIVMMDITMPEMNGIDAIKEILKVDPAAVILICSASNQQDMIVDALEIGAKGYLMKPFKPDRLNEIISKYAIPHLLAKKEEEEKKREAEALAIQQEEEKKREAEALAKQEEEKKREAETLAQQQEEEKKREAEALAQQEEEKKQEAETLAQQPEEEPVKEDAPFMNNSFIRSYNDDTLSIYGSAEDDVEAEEVVEEEIVAEEIVSEEETVEETVVEEVVLENDEEIDEEQAVEYAEELLAEFGTSVEAEEDGQEVYLELEEEEPTPVGIENKPIEHKTYQFPVSRQPINFVTSYMCSWEEEVGKDIKQYSFTCSEEDNKISVEMTNSKNEQQKVELSLDGFRQLFTWMEERFEEGRKHKAVGLK